MLIFEYNRLCWHLHLLQDFVRDRGFPVYELAYGWVCTFGVLPNLLFYIAFLGCLGSQVDSGLRRRRAQVQIAITTLTGNCLRQTVHTHCASVHQAEKSIAALLMVVGVTAGLVESNGSLPPRLWLTSPAGWLPRTGISSGTLRSVIEYGKPLPFLRSLSPSK